MNTSFFEAMESRQLFSAATLMRMPTAPPADAMAIDANIKHAVVQSFAHTSTAPGGNKLAMTQTQAVEAELQDLANVG